MEKKVIISLCIDKEVLQGLDSEVLLFSAEKGKRISRGAFIEKAVLELIEKNKAARGTTK